MYIFCSKDVTFPIFNYLIVVRCFRNKRKICVIGEICVSYIKNYSRDS